MPASDKRWAYMAGGAIGNLLILLGLFLLAELSAARVYNSDQLSIDGGLDVYPLPVPPQAESLRKLDSRAADDQIKRFFQQLDHVWFAFCGKHPEPKQGLCVLVTSAVSAEGRRHWPHSLPGGAAVWE